MVEKEAIVQVVNSFLEHTESFLVDVSVDEKKKFVSVEVDDFEGVSIDFCVELSRHISEQLPEMEEYDMEVSSSGLTSPFKVKQQYEKNLGNEVEVLTKKGEKLSGILKEAGADTFVLACEKMVKVENAKKKQQVIEEKEFNYNEIKYTKNIIRFK